MKLFSYTIFALALTCTLSNPLDQQSSAGKSETSGRPSDLARLVANLNVSQSRVEDMVHKEEPVRKEIVHAFVAVPPELFHENKLEIVTAPHTDIQDPVLRQLVQQNERMLLERILEESQKPIFDTSPSHEDLSLNVPRDAILNTDSHLNNVPLWPFLTRDPLISILNRDSVSPLLNRDPIQHILNRDTRPHRNPSQELLDGYDPIWGVDLSFPPRRQSIERDPYDWRYEVSEDNFHIPSSRFINHNRIPLLEHQLRNRLMLY